MNLQMLTIPTQETRLRDRFRATLVHPGFLIALGICAVAHISLMIKNARGGFSHWDFSHYYVESLALRQGLNPYTTDLRPLGRILGIDGIEHGTYPPFFLLCFEPLTRLSPRIAYGLWLSLNALALVIAAILVCRRSDSLRRTEIVLFAELGILYPPLGDHFAYAQCQIVILLLLVLACTCLERSHERLAGLLVALASLLKVFPVIMLGYFVTTRRWRALRWLGVGVACGALATIASIGPQRALAFTKAHDVITSRQFLLRPANVAIASFLQRLCFDVLGRSVGGRWGLADACGYVAEAGLLALTAMATLRAYGDGEASRRGFVLWTVTMIELSPTAWVHYMVILFLPMALILEERGEDAADGRAVTLIILSYVLSFGIFLVPLLHGVGRRVAEESATISLLVAWIAAYFFATADGALSPPPRSRRARSVRACARSRDRESSGSR